MNNYSKQQQEHLDAIKTLWENDTRAESHDSLSDLAIYLYDPDERLNYYLKKLKEYAQISNLPQKNRPNNFNTLAGNLLEQISYLCFSSLRGVSSIKSLQSPGPQYDLLVSGNDTFWKCLCDQLYIEYTKRDFIIECKATKNKVGDQQFSRMCSLLQLNKFDTSQLGIFFTLQGASGFPEENQKRLRSLRDAKLRQVMFNISTSKRIIVLDKNDLLSLGNPGSLVKIMVSKIQDIMECSGKYTRANELLNNPIEKDLPKHLKHL
jgi:hypothetical protein